MWPTSFAHTITHTFGAAGEQWLTQLPALLSTCAARWQLTLGAPFPLNYNYVTAATRRDGQPVVLKLGVPNPELATEIAALQHYAGRGSVQLLAADWALGAFLLERVEPGTTLWDWAPEQDVRATTIAADLMRQLWRPPPPGPTPYPTVADWAQGLQGLRQHFQGGTGPFPTRLVAYAEGLFAELLPSQAPAVVLHGDLHHGNILRATRQRFLAIDPKGILGEPAYETGAWLRNPIPGFNAWPDYQAVVRRRVAQLAAELALEAQRIRGWGLAQAVLSAWWSFESHDPAWAATLDVATALIDQI